MLEKNPLLARRVAAASLIVDTLFQTLALLGDAESSRSSPSAIYVAYAPHPYAPIGLFSAGLIFQIQWLLRLCLPSKDLEEDGTSAIPLQITPSKVAPILLTQDESATVDPMTDPDVDFHKIKIADNDLPLHNDDEVDGFEEFNSLEPAYFSFLPFYIIGSVLQGSSRYKTIHIHQKPSFNEEIQLAGQRCG